MAMDGAQGLVQPSSNNNNETEQENIEGTSGKKKEDDKSEETLFDKIFIRICLYVIPVLLFIALPNITKTISLLTGSTEINYLACYGLYIVVIELLRKIHTTADNSTRALHVFNQSFVYVPLSLFLFTASYALYSAGSEVFGVQPAEQRQAFVQEVDKFLATYKAQCTQASVSPQEQHQCIESYLNATLFADVKLIQEKYGDASNSYSIIAIMTGFFGVLMTVLVIYFSLSGRELLEHKLQKSEELMDELKSTIKNTKKGVADAIKIAAKASELATEASKAATDATIVATDANEALVQIAKSSALVRTFKSKVDNLQNDSKTIEFRRDEQSEGQTVQKLAPPKEEKQVGGNDEKSNSEFEKGTGNTIKTFDDRLNITGGESLKEGLEYTLTFYTCMEDFNNKQNSVELKQVLPYPFKVDKINADSAEVITRFDEKTILVVSLHPSNSKSPASEEVFFFKPSNASKPDDSDKHKKIDTANDTNKI